MSRGGEVEEITPALVCDFHLTLHTQCKDCVKASKEWLRWMRVWLPSGP